MSERRTLKREVVRVHRGNPGYHSRLPNVFPYYWNGSLEEVQNLTEHLLDNSVTGYLPGEEMVGGLWFAVTGHKETLDGHVTLWLSAQAAQWLLRMTLISTVLEYEQKGY
jgi:hypothetical protein